MQCPEAEYLQKEVKSMVISLFESSIKYRSSLPEVFLGKGVLKICSKIYRRTSMPKCDFNKVLKQLYWNHTSAWVLFCRFAAYFQNNLLLKHLWKAASGNITGLTVYYQWQFTIAHNLGQKVRRLIFYPSSPSIQYWEIQEKHHIYFNIE